MDQRALEILALFPGLSNDPFFSVTSKKDVNYNCISWAHGMYKDRWMMHDTSPRLDGVRYWWPKGVPQTPHLQSYILAFESVGFEICQDSSLESGYVKIALYVNPSTGFCLHASRQKLNGVWMSKLGKIEDIEHGIPQSLEGPRYGVVACIMRKSRD